MSLRTELSDNIHLIETDTRRILFNSLTLEAYEVSRDELQSLRSNTPGPDVEPVAAFMRDDDDNLRAKVQQKRFEAHRLGVMSREVVEPGGRRGTDRGVDAMMIVEVQPSRQRGPALRL